ncbi:hypothetical protein [Paenibacillus sp. sgz302251]|uniref:hypothetical protein n=1 Tax=Paenibacillus sp. sgz302251 TaxID=3414493 RepID=UPI003C7B28E1
MADEQDMKELKESLQRLELEVERLTEHSKRRGSGPIRFIIAFLIVFFVLFIGIGVIQFMNG